MRFMSNQTQTSTIYPTAIFVATARIAPLPLNVTASGENRKGPELNGAVSMSAKQSTLSERQVVPAGPSRFGLAMLALANLLIVSAFIFALFV